MTAKSDANSKRNRDCLEMWEPPSLPDAPQFNLPERRLLCQILRENISAAKRGDQRSVYWLQSDDSGFTEIIGLLQLDPSIIQLIRKSVSCSKSHPARHRNQYSMANPAKPASAAALPARPDVPWPSVTVPPAPITAKLTARPWKPFPDSPAPIWIDGICLQTLPLPKIVRRRRENPTALQIDEIDESKANSKRALQGFT